MIPQANSAKIASEGIGGKSVSEVDNEVLKERGMIIDATCVRIMKARKVETHNELVASIIR